MSYWSVILGGHSSLNMCRLRMKFKILGEILVIHTQVGQSSLTMCRLNLNLKILGELLDYNTEGAYHR